MLQCRSGERPTPVDRDRVYTTLMVAVWHGDWHGNKECSIMSMEKAMMIGAQMAAVDVNLNNNKVYLESGELLSDAVDSQAHGFVSYFRTCRGAGAAVWSPSALWFGYS